MELFNFYVFATLTLFAITISWAKPPPPPDDIGTNFFLKASKSVPRIGRRMVDYENYFLKASKSIPRIGRRTINADTETENEWIAKMYQEPIKKSYYDKYFKGNEQPGWTDLEKINQDYSGTIQVDDTYQESGSIPVPEPYWKRIKKDEETVKDQPQVQTK